MAPRCWCEKLFIFFRLERSKFSSSSFGKAREKAVFGSRFWGSRTLNIGSIKLGATKNETKPTRRFRSVGYKHRYIQFDAKWKCLLERNLRLRELGEEPEARAESVSRILCDDRLFVASKRDGKFKRERKVLNSKNPFEANFVFL